MPVPAAVEPQVFPGDLDPLEVLRRGKHLLDELAVLVLDSPPLHQRSPGLGDPVGEPVADGLELAEVEHPRSGRGGLDPVRDLGVSEGLGEEIGELGLEAGDLPAQLQSRPSLVDRDPKPGEFLLSQQSRHSEKCRSGGT
jgi:hypothetical protein